MGCFFLQAFKVDLPLQHVTQGVQTKGVELVWRELPRPVGHHFAGCDWCSFSIDQINFPHLSFVEMYKQISV